MGTVKPVVLCLCLFSQRSETETGGSDQAVKASMGYNVRPAQNPRTNQSIKLAEETRGTGSEEQGLHLPFCRVFSLYCLSLIPKTGSFYVTLAGLELLMSIRMVLNSQGSAWLCLQSAGIKDTCHHTSPPNAAALSHLLTKSAGIRNGLTDKPRRWPYQRPRHLLVQSNLAFQPRLLEAVGGPWEGAFRGQGIPR